MAPHRHRGLQSIGDLFEHQRSGQSHCNVICTSMLMNYMTIWFIWIIELSLYRSCFVVQFKARQNVGWWVKVCFHGQRDRKYEHQHDGRAVYLPKADHGIKCVGNQTRDYLLWRWWQRDALWWVLWRSVSSHRSAKCQALCRRLGDMRREPKLVRMQICWHVFRNTHPKLQPCAFCWLDRGQWTLYSKLLRAWRLDCSMEFPVRQILYYHPSCLSQPFEY